VNNTTSGFAELLGSSSEKIETFYHDLPPDVAESFVGQLMPQTLKSFYEDGDVAYAGWMDVPTWYVAATQDHTGPVAFQRGMVDEAIKAGADVTSRELDTGHSPFLSQPEELVQLIVAAGNEFGSGK
jgi:pimeloyl-ACP methyl ester carboxylesterase